MRNPDQSKLMELIRDYGIICWQEGVQVGHIAAAQNLIETSGRKFVLGMDDQAREMRETGRQIQKEIKEREQIEKPKRDKRKDGLYKEILGHLENMVEVDKDADFHIETDALIAEVRRRNNV